MTEQNECSALAHCCMLADALARKFGDSLAVGGIFWATHKDHADYPKEKLDVPFGMGQFFGDWYVGYVQPSAVAAHTPEMSSLGDMFLAFINVNTKSKVVPVSMSTMRKIAEKLRDSYEIDLDGRMMSTGSSVLS